MQKPAKTLADYLVIAISPILIMILVGSLAFFLIQVLYRGELVPGVRWLMFWFVLAIVLVSRVAIEHGKAHARFYGVALAIVTWLYLAYMRTTPFLGAILLAITWWCAHRLTVDCTLIREDEDASGEGVLEGVWRKLEKSFLPPAEPVPPLPPLTAIELMAAADLASRRSQMPQRPPGKSVVYFSLAALPLFGVGQLLLPADDPNARRIGFAFLALYLAAALGLLVTTSFLGLRRYLRQRSVEMPGSITFGWLKFGAFLAGGVLLLAMILPRPGGGGIWNFARRDDHKEHKASDHALPFNPPGEGEGTPANQPVQRNQPGVDSRNAPPGNGTQPARNDNPNQSSPRNQPDQTDQSGGGGGGSGSQVSSGQGGQSGNRTPSMDGDRQRTPDIQIRDNTPPGGSDQPSDRDQRDRSGGESGEGKGNGDGRQPGKINQSPQRNQPTKDSERPERREQKPAVEKEQREQPQPQPQENATKVQKQPSDILSRLLRWLLILALVGLFIWLTIRYRKTIAQMIRSFVAAVREFFRKLFSFRRRKSEAPVEDNPPPVPVLEPFAAYENPFVTGKDGTWTPEKLLIYTYEAVQAWAIEQRIELEPQETPREFCSRLIERFPDFGPELEQFSFYYSHAAFAERLPEDFETESIKRLWQYLGDSVMVTASN